MTQVIYYDKPFYLPIILDLSGLTPSDKEIMIPFMEEIGAEMIKFVSDFTLPAVNTMLTHGYPHLAQSPNTLKRPEANQLFARSLKLFNPKAVVNRDPDASRIDLSVNDVSDYVRIVDALTLQQDNITLSQFWDIGNLSTVPHYVTRATPLTSRLSRNVVRVPRAQSKKALEERVEFIKAEIEKAFKLQTEELEAEFKRSVENVFRYGSRS